MAMLARMPSPLLTLWQAYHRLEPFGDHVQDARDAQHAYISAVGHGLKKHGGGKFTPQDFAEHKPIVTAQEPSTVAASIRAWAESFRGVNNGR